MISDFVKGRKKFDYPPGILGGIQLHRLIDQFTDSHEAVREAKQVFRPYYRLYSGAFVDVVFDHFLANDAGEYDEQSLLEFSEWVYARLESDAAWLPERFDRMVPYMKKDNWLFHYRTRRGTGKSLEGVVRRAAYLTDSSKAFEVFEQEYQFLGDCYRHFWGSLKSYAERAFVILKEDPRAEVIG